MGKAIQKRKNNSEREEAVSAGSAEVRKNTLLKGQDVRMEHIVQALVNFFQNTIPPELTVFTLSLMPVIELRGGILAAKLLNVDMLRAFFICLAGTLIPTPFILLFINKIFDWMRNTRFVKLVDRLEAKGRSKFDKINRYKLVGLMIFVAIPLPGTGAWTGSLAAALMKMDFKSAMISVALGTLIADVIMCLLSYGVLGLVI